MKDTSNDTTNRKDNMAGPVIIAVAVALVSLVAYAISSMF